LDGNSSAGNLPPPERRRALEHHNARQACLLTERTRQQFWPAQHRDTQHVPADAQGELV